MLELLCQLHYKPFFFICKWYRPIFCGYFKRAGFLQLFDLILILQAVLEQP
ncbi:hypothetical protein SORDD16_01647 [Streptococcus oralis]|uniref:Uncharacterized protein n=1 Tax=Streptococcus oralis TaxID=1303 RepID=A0A139P9Y7_STROR|nr:hypothetical protein SORDD16_01647 [Streptococcus oralis]